MEETFREMALDELINRRDLKFSMLYRSIYQKVLKERTDAHAEAYTQAKLTQRTRAHGFSHPGHKLRNNIADKTAKSFEDTKSVPSVAVASAQSDSCAANSPPIGVLASAQSGNDQTMNYVNPADVSGNSSNFVPASSGYETALQLGDFLSRPVLIYETYRDLNLLADAINPWALWSSTPSIRAKLTNYAFFRGDLELRIIVASNRYHMGCTMLSYQPFPLANPILQAHLDCMATEDPTGDAKLNPCLYNYLSSSPETQYIRYGEDLDLIMKLPMIIPTQTLRLSNQSTSAITNANEFEEFSILGDLIIRDLIDFQRLSPTSNLASIQIFAKMTNIELGPPTGTNIDITAQSDSTSAPGKAIVAEMGGAKLQKTINNSKVLNTVADRVSELVDDEYADAGPLSKITSAVSNVAGKLNDVPIVGQVAQATQYVTAKGAKMLKFFGFSTPNILENIKFYKPMVTRNLATTDAHDPSCKLTVDSKQGISIMVPNEDVPIDPMAITSISSREAFLETFEWSSDDTPLTDTLFMCPITPMLYSKFTNNTGERVYQLTPMMQVASQFSFWRGDITFHIQVIGSAFHKGKLMFIYEPNVYAFATNETAVTNANQMVFAVMDIEKERDLHITVPFVNDKNYASTYVGFTDIASNPIFDDFKYKYPTTSDFTDMVSSYGAHTNTGYLFVRPFNNLTSVESLDISINVFVSCKNLQVAVPYDLNGTPSSTMTAQNDVMTAQSDNRDFAAVTSTLIQTPHGVETSARTVVLNLARASDENLNLLQMGESITSIRQLLKRGQSIWAGDLDQAAGFQTLGIPLYPPIPNTNVARYGTIPNQANSNNIYYTPRMTTFSYNRQCFLFAKGGFRYLFRNLGVSNTSGVTFSERGMADIVVRRRWTNSGKATISGGATSTEASLGADGACIFHQEVGNLCDVEVPFYSANLFDSSSLCYDETTPVLADLFDQEQTRIVIKFFSGLATTQAEVSCRAAEDFTFFRFQGSNFFVFA